MAQTHDGAAGGPRLRARMVYDSPYGGETLGVRSAVKAYARVARFLAVCTSAPPSPAWPRVAEEFDAGERTGVMRLHHFPLLFTVPGGDEPLPYQGLEHYPPNPAQSQLLFTLETRRAPSLILTACLPFEEPGPEFLAYYEAMCEALSWTLPRGRFRRASPNKRGDAEVFRRITF